MRNRLSRHLTNGTTWCSADFGVVWIRYAKDIICHCSHSIAHTAALFIIAAHVALSVWMGPVQKILQQHHQIVINLKSNGNMHILWMLSESIAQSIYCRQCYCVCWLHSLFSVEFIFMILLDTETVHRGMQHTTHCSNHEILCSDIKMVSTTYCNKNVIEMKWSRVHAREAFFQ